MKWPFQTHRIAMSRAGELNIGTWGSSSSSLFRPGTMPKRAYIGYIQLQFFHNWLDLAKPVQYICIQIMPSQYVPSSTDSRVK